MATLTPKAEQALINRRLNVQRHCEAIRQVILAAGDAGISTMEICGLVQLESSTVRKNIHLFSLGHSARNGHKTVLHFATMAQANAFSADPHAHAQRHRPKPKKSSRATSEPAQAPTVLAATHPAVPPSVTITLRALEGQAMRTDKTVVIKAPEPQPRISTKDADLLFSTLQPGNYLKAETWASRHLSAR